MTDVFNPEKRSQVMSAIHSKGNKSTELALISIFKLNKISGWRRNFNLIGKPDFTFPSQKLIVFVDGLKKNGWKVIRIWECEIRKRNYVRKLNRILSIVNH